MAIYTRFGSHVEIVKAERVDGSLWVTIKRQDGSTMVTLPRELKADGGSLEIEKAIDEAR